jgi:hypothetical protein
LPDLAEEIPEVIEGEDEEAKNINEKLPGEDGSLAATQKPQSDIETGELEVE